MYCTVTQLASHYGWSKLADKVNHDQQTFDDKSVTAAALQLVASGQGDQLPAAERPAAETAVLYLEERIRESGRFMDSYLGLRFVLPLSSSAISRLPVQACCEVLTFELLSPDSGAQDKEIRTQADKWRDWLQQQGSKNLPPDTGGQGPASSADGMGVVVKAIGSNWDWSGY